MYKPNIRALVAEKYPVEQGVSRLKSVNLTTNMAILNLTFKITVLTF